jgi:hypothetical protein
LIAHYSNSINQPENSMNTTTATSHPTRTVARLEATNPAGETCAILVVQHDLKPGRPDHRTYEVYVVGGFLGSGDENAYRATLGEALRLASAEATSCILGD